MNWITRIIIIALIVLYLKERKNKITGAATDPQTVIEPIQIADSYAGHYQPKYLLTRNEWYEYKKLKQYAAAHDLQICPKVRLLDIVEPRRGDPNYMSYLGKIKSKHVDFLICDQDLHIKGIVELDDNSHDTKGRQQRDNFVDNVLTSVGYKVIHTRGITETTLDTITASQHTTQ